MKLLYISDYVSWWWAEIICNYNYKLFKEKSKIIYLEDFISKNKILKLFSMFGFNIFLYLKLKKILKNYNPDIIHLHNYNLAPITVLLAIKKCKNIQTVHASWQICPSTWWVYRLNYKKCNLLPQFKKCMKNCFFDKPKIPWVIYYFIHRFIVKLRKKYINYFIFPSQALKKWFELNWFKNLYHVKNPVILDWIDNDNINWKENIILYVWKLIELKWVHLLVKALKELNLNNWKFIFIWDWPLKKALIKDTKNDKRFKFKWKINFKEVKNFYKKSKIVITPSIYFENQPWVIIEWLLYNNIIIWNKSWWIPELLDKNLIINLENKNIKTLKEKILKVIKNNDNYLKISLKCKKRLLWNNLDNYKKELNKIYKLILK